MKRESSKPFVRPMVGRKSSSADGNLVFEKIAAVFLILVGLFGANARAENELKIPANELGKVMVLMYHQIKNPDGTWVRAPKGFKSDLELLYKKGYYLVNLVDLIDGKLNVPAGKTPVVLTFDDAAEGQFEKKNAPNNGGWDPESAVGMINAMYEKHPDFGRAGSFYLNRKSEDPLRKGSHPGISAQLREMVELGYELGNHTLNHPKLNGLDQRGVAREIAELQRWVESIVPGYRMRTMAMPHGIYPENEKWAVEGEYNGVRYHNEALLKVGSEPSVSPYSKAFRPSRISRVRGSELLDRPSEKTSIAYIRLAVDYFERNPSQRFISDGNPNVVTVPAGRIGEVRANLPAGLKVVERK